MSDLRLYLANPSRDDAVRAREALLRQGFRTVRLADSRRHTPRQRISEDAVVVGNSSTIESDCMGRCVCVDSIEDLVSVEPDDSGRPVAVQPKEIAKRLKRGELFALARETGADIRMTMSNAALADAIERAEADPPPAKSSEDEEG